MANLEIDRMNHCTDDIPRMKQELIRLIVELLHAEPFAHMIIQDSFQIAARIVSSEQKQEKQPRAS